MTKNVRIEGRKYRQEDLDCIECGSKLTLKRDHFGVRYLCSSGSCRGSLGAHPDGSPLGVQADRATKDARINAHEDFDRIWKTGLTTRTGAYRWLTDSLGAVETVHIGRMNKEECMRVTQLVRKKFPSLFPFSNDFE